MKLMAPGKRIILRAVRPNVGVRNAYGAALNLLVAKMHNAFVEMLQAAYPHHLAQDATPIEGISKAALNAKMEQFGRDWIKKMGVASASIAEAFATGAMKAGDTALKASLRNAGMSVKFQPSPRMMKAYRDTIDAQIGLIKSIPPEYIGHAQELIMSSIEQGRNMSEAIREIGPMVDLSRIRMALKPGETAKSLLVRTQRRANLIVRDQNNKATAIMNQARQRDLGITRAIWRHSGGGVNPRPEHEAADGEEYDIDEGLPIGDDGENVLPGECVNCRCICLSVVPGTEDEDQNAA